MKISEVMTKNVVLARPDQSIRDAARMMLDLDAGSLPIGENERLVGMVTDRDIAVRAVAQGKGPDTAIRDVMTGEVKYCFDDEEIETVAHNMGDIKVRRLPVLDRDKRLVGIVTLGDVALGGDPDATDDALSGVSEPGGAHSQTSKH
jgi:CBS domain-containing protein